jgi:hypothetical protein
MNGATATKSKPCNKPKMPPASAASARRELFVTLRERATHDMPTQHDISQATGVAQITPGCRRSKATKITAPAQAKNGSHTDFNTARKSKATV